MTAESRNEYLQGGTGNDMLIGYEGSWNGNQDTLVAGPNNVLYGEDNNCTFVATGAQMYAGYGANTFVLQSSSESNDDQFATIHYSSNSNCVVDLTAFEQNNGVQCFWAPGDYTEAISVAYGAAGTPELFFEMAGEHYLSVNKLHV